MLSIQSNNIDAGLCIIPIESEVTQGIDTKLYMTPIESGVNPFDVLPKEIILIIFKYIGEEFLKIRVRDAFEFAKENDNLDECKELLEDGYSFSKVYATDLEKLKLNKEFLKKITLQTAILGIKKIYSSKLLPIKLCCKTFKHLVSSNIEGIAREASDDVSNKMKNYFSYHSSALCCNTLDCIFFAANGELEFCQEILKAIPELVVINEDEDENAIGFPDEAAGHFIPKLVLACQTSCYNGHYAISKEIIAFMATYIKSTNSVFQTYVINHLADMVLQSGKKKHIIQTETLPAAKRQKQDDA